VVKLVQSLRFRHDNFDYLEPMSGSDLHYLTRRTYPRVRLITAPAIPGVQAATPFVAELIVPWSPRFLANPYDIFLPAMNVGSEFHYYGRFSTATSNAASAPGSGALIAGGDRTVTIPTFQVTVTEMYSESAVRPKLMPLITRGSTAQFAAATTELPYELTTQRQILLDVFQYRLTSDVIQDGINAITLLSGNVRRWDRVAYLVAKGIEQNQFPAVPAPEIGTIGFNFADNGKFRQALNPKRMGSQPRYLFDVAAPVGVPGFLERVSIELMTRDGITAIERD
jgi:hypothetical protein